jgi:ferrous iron transport protein B
VDVSRGRATVAGVQVEVVDTPGMYSFHPITEEERVARAILLSERPDIVLHVVDAKNLERMLPLTLQLIEAGLPVVVQLNMMDEAEAAGVHIDVTGLGRQLGVPVVPTVAVTGAGMDALVQALAGPRTPPRTMPSPHGKDIESALTELSGMMSGDYAISRRSVARLLLEGDAEMAARVKTAEDGRFDDIQSAVAAVRSRYSQPLGYVLTLDTRRAAENLLSTVVTAREGGRRGFAARLSDAMMHPISGGVIFLAVVYLGLYQFVGVFGAGTLVDFIESTMFGEWINPWFADLATRFIPWTIAQDLFVGEYGIITLGLTYAIAIVFPIVGTFSIVFAIVEDSGYLPRLAMLIDRVFKGIGLNGRAVIPIVLGFGCDTMATIVTRTQETRRERVITTLLLALAIPCSAQLGVIFGILSGSPGALLVWIGAVTFVFLLVGFLTARLLPGERASFYMEVPPLRMPRIGNVLSKTVSRLEWYFVEVLPLFVLASVVLWVGDLTGVFDVIVGGLEPVVELLGLPREAAVAFLYGFFRRDFGAAGLFDLNSAGLLTGVPLVVSAVTITLFVPCIAQALVMVKERGLRTAVAIVAFVFPFAFLVGFALNWLLTTLGVTL